MATRYRVQVDDEIIEFEGPDNLSDEQITKLADTELRTRKPGESFQPSVYGGEVTDPNDPKLTMDLDSSAGGSFLRGLPQDASFNWNDEFTGLMNAAVPGLAALDNATGASQEQESYWNADEGTSFWDVVKRNAQATKAQQEIDAGQHPTASATGRIAGVVSSLPRAGAAVAARLPQAAKAAMASRPITTGAVLAGTGGATSGAGAGDPGHRSQSAALGGITGVALGAGLTAGMQFAPAVATYAKILFGRGSDQEAIAQIVRALKRDGFDVSTPSGVQALRSELGKYTDKPVSIADVGNAVRGRTGVALRAPSNQQSQSIDKIIQRSEGQRQRLSRDIHTNVAPRTDIHALEEDLVAQRAEQADKLRRAALLEEAPAPEPPPGELMYNGGSPYMSRKGITYFTPDRDAAESYVTMHNDRFGAGGQVNDAYVNLTNPAPIDVVRETARKAGVEVESSTPASWFDENLHGRDAVENLRTALQRQGYDGTRLPDIPYGGPPKEIEAVIPFDQSVSVQSPPIAQNGLQSRIVDDPMLNQIVRTPLGQKALERALTLARGEYTLKAARNLPTDDVPYITDGSSLDARTFDYVKRFLDKEVTRLYRQGSTDTFSAAEAEQVKELRNALRGRMREVVPGYGDYLDAYSGSSEMIDALDAGVNFDRLAPELIQSSQATRSDAAQELYRTGAARNLIDTIRNTKDGRNPASRILNSDESREQLQATGLDPAAFGRLNTSVQQERVLNQLPAELQGAQTQSRLAAEQDANAGMDLTIPYNLSNPTNWFGMAGRGLLNKISHNRNVKVNDALLPRMLETDPVGVERVITELEQAGNAAAARQLRRQLQQRNVAALGGTIIGGPVSIQGE